MDAVPLCISSKDVDEIVKQYASGRKFGGINLEDIAAPRCFEIGKAKQRCDIHVYLDDRTALPLSFWPHFCIA